VRLVGSLLLVASLLAPPAFGGGLSVAMPAEGPSAQTLAGWQKITGDVTTATERITYQLYVNPARQAIYEVTRYQVTHLSKNPAGRVESRLETEKFLWNSKPGVKSPRCFERLGSGAWTEMEAGSAAYRGEMLTAIRVYGFHQRALRLR
jgi:hypothetical protein